MQHDWVCRPWIVSCGELDLCVGDRGNIARDAIYGDGDELRVIAEA